MPKQKIYIPTYISSINYDPARVLPRIMFYNGLLETDPYYIQDSDGLPNVQNYFPYFDNYSGNLPTTSSLSLLFNNETAPYGDIPSQSLYSQYWSTYIDLLYNPVTRVINCKAIIPLADYYKMNLNDIVEWRGNYYHLRAINDYNLSNGECNLQLLGPTIGDVIANILPGQQCDFDFSIEDYTPPPQPEFYMSRCDGSAQLRVSFTSSLSMSIGDVFTLPSSYFLDDCWYVSSSYSGALDLDNISISQSFATCEICSASLHPTPPPTGSYYSVQLCSGGPTYSINPTTTPTIGASYTISSSLCVPFMDGTNCWTVVGTTPTPPEMECESVFLGAEYVNCDSCSISSCNEYKIAAGGYDITWEAWSCNNVYKTGTVPAGQTRYTGCIQSETLNVTGTGASVTLFAYC